LFRRWAVVVNFRVPLASAARFPKSHRLADVYNIFPSTPFSFAMAAKLVCDSEMLPIFIPHRKVRRSRCMCLLFLFLIATFVGLTPIVVYRSLGVPLPDGLRGHGSVILSQFWMNVSQLNPASGSPPPDGADTETMWSAQSRSRETATEPKTAVIPRDHPPPSTPT